jgi:hypothetical protein
VALTLSHREDCELLGSETSVNLLLWSEGKTEHSPVGDSLSKTSNVREDKRRPELFSLQFEIESDFARLLKNYRKFRRANGRTPLHDTGLPVNPSSTAASIA